MARLQQWPDASLCQVFNGTSWLPLGANSASGGGISNSASSVSDLAVATDGTKVTAAWSQPDAQARQQIYLREYNGAAWVELSGSASGGGSVQRLVRAGRLPLPISVESCSSRGSRRVVRRLLPLIFMLPAIPVDRGPRPERALCHRAGVSHSTGSALQAKLAANGGNSYLTWVNNPLVFQTNPGLNIYAEVWNGTAFVEEVPGDASYGGVASISIQSRTLAMAVDTTGHPFLAWDDVMSGTASVLARGNTFDLHRLFLADSASTLQTILDSQILGPGDVIAVKPDITYATGLNITSADAGVVIVGAADGSTVIQGAVVVSGPDVVLQRLTINGGVTSSSDRLMLVANTIRGSGLTINGGVGWRVVQNVFAGATGMRFAAPASGYIANNRLQVTGTGLDVSSAFTGLIYGNDIVAGTTGVAYGASAILSSNQIHGAATGVNVTVVGEPAGFGFIGTARSNQVYGNQTGVTLASGARIRAQHIYGNATGVTGSGLLGGNDLDTANLIELNTVGVNFTGTIQFNRVANNGTGIAATNGQLIVHNLLYRNLQTALLVDNKTDVRIVDNTIYSLAGDSIRVQGRSTNVEVRGNVIWSETGYDLYVANDSQVGFYSDYNDLHASGTGKVAYWTKDFTDILDLQADVAAIDLHSIGRTVVNPNWSEPRFYDRAADDYRLFDLVAGQRFSSPTADAGDPLTDQGMPAFVRNLLNNPGFESGLTNWSTNLNALVRSSTPLPFEGSNYFHGGAVQLGFAQQTIDLPGSGYTVADLDSQDLVIAFGGRVRSLAEQVPDEGKITVIFLDSTNAPIGVGGEARAQNVADRWELTGARVRVPVGTRSIRFRFEATLRSGTTADSYFDNAFTYIYNDTLAPNQGAYGNTVAELSETSRPHIALRFPDLYTDWENDRPRKIRWESYNNTTESNVRIDLYRDDPLHGSNPRKNHCCL